MKKIIIGNFKMNTVPSEFKPYAMTLATKIKGTKNEVVICPPFTHLSMAREILSGTQVLYGAQNLAEEERGEFTGEISASMLKDLGTSYVIVGHSERRGKFKETDKVVNKKIKTALANGIKVVLCVGENLQTKTSKQANAFVRKQLEEALRGLFENELESVVIAYEPIWASGTGKAISNKDIVKMVETIRNFVGELYSEKAGKNLNVLYGGSVSLSNYKKIMSIDCIDGVVIGGASLDVDNFALICKEKY